MIDSDEISKQQDTKRKYEFGKAFENILFFPFRVLFFVIKWATRIILISFLALVVYIAIHGALPMQIPEAQGATYYQFMADRHKAMMLDPENTIKFELELYGFANANYFALYVFVIPFCSVFPDFDKWDQVTRCSDLPRSYRDMFVTYREDLKWTDLPILQWETYERFMWLLYVDNNHLPKPDFSKNE